MSCLDPRGTGLRPGFVPVRSRFTGGGRAPRTASQSARVGRRASRSRPHEAAALDDLVALAAAAGHLVAAGVEALLAAHARLHDERVACRSSAVMRDQQRRRPRRA